MDLSIVTVNYNAALSTIKLVSSLANVLKDSSLEWEILIVDNGSDAESVTLLESVVGVKLIKNSDNLGFAGGNNCGIIASKGEYIMLLNNDTIVKEDIFTPLIAFLTKNKIIGAASPKIVYDTVPNLIQYAGYDTCDKFLFAITSTYHGKKESEVKDIAVQTPFIHGAAVIFRGDMIKRVGLLREDYFLYFEELDYSLRIAEMGYEVWYYPFVKVFHNASHTTSRNSYAKIYYNSRNRLYLAANNLKGKERVAAIAMQLMFSLPKNILKSLLVRDVNTAISHLHGAWHFCICRRGKL